MAKGRRGKRGLSSQGPRKGATKPDNGHASNNYSGHTFNFVTAESPRRDKGSRHSQDESKKLDSMADMNLERIVIDSNNVEKSRESNHSSNGNRIGEDRNGIKDNAVSEAEKSVYFVDTKGSEVYLPPKLPPHKLRRSISFSTDSSEEEIVFTGRSHVQKSGNGGEESSQSFTKKPKSEQIEDVTAVVASVAIQHPAPINSRSSRTPALADFGQSPSQGFGRLHDVFSYGEGPKFDRPLRRDAQSLFQEEERLADYIANIQAHDDPSQSEGSVDLKEPDHQSLTHLQSKPRITKSSAQIEKPVLPGDATEWDSTDLHDFDHLSTSEETGIEVDRILSERERPSGKQYLVVGMGNSTDEARWIPLNSLYGPKVAESIRLFESQRLETRSSSSELSSDKENHLAEHLYVNEPEASHDSNATKQDSSRTKRRHLPDHEIARLLSVQEELGLGSSELLLFDENDDDEEEQSSGDLEEEDIDLDLSWAHKFQPLRALDPLASSGFSDLEEDLYGSFDVLDRARPSLRKKPKRGSEMNDLELSDAELRLSLQKSWQKDRLKKKLRKQEREERHAQGLLSKRQKGKPNVIAKHREAMSMDQVKDEIMGFLSSSTT
ncbi:MAG: hypothetical protein Q9190_006789, partial [Brigantiaea leucoxantha]